MAARAVRCRCGAGASRPICVPKDPCNLLPQAQGGDRPNLWPIAKLYRSGEELGLKPVVLLFQSHTHVVALHPKRNCSMMLSMMTPDSQPQILQLVPWVCTQYVHDGER